MPNARTELMPVWTALHQLHPTWREAFIRYLHRHMMENTAPLESTNPPILTEALDAWMDAFAKGEDISEGVLNKPIKRRTVLVER